MYFTQEDFIKIQEFIQRNSIKDSDFNEAHSLDGSETVTIVQNKQNRKVFLRDLADQMAKFDTSDFLNINDKYKVANITLEEAIKYIPTKARKEGQIITFSDINNNWHIYQFRGSLNQWNNLELWEDLFDWEKLIINSILPDEEDLTKSPADENGNSYLSLRDREYKPEDFSGLGRVILRKNIVEVEDPIYGKVKKNILYQDMFTQSNTIYEIRYDFDLNGNEITIPEGCTLNFQGGSFLNGTIVGSDTTIKSNINKIFGTDVLINGTWINKNVYSDWFDLCDTEDKASINTVIINNLLSLANGLVTTDLIISAPFIIYVKIIENGFGTFNVPSYTNITINATIQMIAANIGQYYLFNIDNKEHVSIHGGHIIGDVETHIGTSGEWGMGIHVNQSRYVNISNIRCSKFWGDGIDVDGEHDNNSEFVIIENVECDYNRRQGISITGCNNGKIVNCLLHDTGNILLTAPGHGLDIETYKHSSTLKEHTVNNIIVDNVTTYNNNYNGVSVSTVVNTDIEFSKNIKVINCTIAEGINLSGNEIVVENCNIGRHIEFRPIKNSIIRNCKAGTRLLFYNTIDNVTFENCYFKSFGNTATMSDTSTNPVKAIDINFFNCYFEDIKNTDVSADFQKIDYASDVFLKFHKCTIIGNDTANSLRINYGRFYDCHITSHWDMQITNKGTRDIVFIKCYLQARGGTQNKIYFPQPTSNGNNIAIACDIYAASIEGYNFTGYMNRTMSDNN